MAANIKYLNYYGNTVILKNVKELQYEREDGSGKETFSHGKAEENVPITLDFSAGVDQIVTSKDGYLIKSANIAKPSSLVPENIAEGVNIAGVIGNHVGGGGVGDFDTTDNALHWYLYKINGSNKSIVLYSQSDEVIGATRTDWNIPDKIGGYNTIVRANGINGSFFNSKTYLKNVVWGANVNFLGNAMSNFLMGMPNLNCPVKIPDNIIYANSLIRNCNNFNAPVTIGENSSLKYAESMFYYCDKFNQPVNLPSNLTHANNMFMQCGNFNQPVNLPNSLIYAYNMFRSCNKFNQPVNFPETLNRMDYMFTGCQTFNQPITIMNINAYCGHMFWNAGNFNAPVTATANLANSVNMFANCQKFNSPVTVAGGISYGMNTFMNCQNFNSTVTVGGIIVNAYGMFNNCIRFNRPVEIKAYTMQNAFHNCRNFNAPVAIRYAYNLHSCFKNCNNMAQNITLFGNGMSGYYMTNFLYGKNNAKRINLFVQPNCNINTYAQVANTYSMFGSAVTWTQDPDNSCFYNATRNVYVYYTVVPEW